MWLLVAAGTIRSAVADSDILYVGDGTTNTVKRFNANTGSPISGGAAPVCSSYRKAAALTGRGGY